MIPVTYTINFYSGNTRTGTTVYGTLPFTSATYEAGSTISYPTVAAASQTCRYAYYGGWKSNRAGTVNAPSTMPSNNLDVFYAVGYRAHTVTWQTVKSDETTYENYSSGTFEYGVSVTYPSTPTAPANYEWGGWTPSAITSMGCGDVIVNGIFNKSATCTRELIPCTSDVLPCTGDGTCTCDTTDAEKENGMGFNITHDFSSTNYSEYTITLDLLLNGSSIGETNYTADTNNGVNEVWISNLTMYEGMTVTLSIYFEGKMNGITSGTMYASVSPSQIVISLGSADNPISATHLQ